MKQPMGVIILRKTWLSFLSNNPDLIRTGFEIVKSPKLKFLGDYHIPYDARGFYEVAYLGKSFIISEDEVVEWVYA